MVEAWETSFRDAGIGDGGGDSGFQKTEQPVSGLKFLQMLSAAFWKCFSRNSYETQESPDHILKELLKSIGLSLSI